MIIFPNDFPKCFSLKNFGHTVGRVQEAMQYVAPPPPPPPPIFKNGQFSGHFVSDKNKNFVTPLHKNFVFLQIFFRKNFKNNFRKKISPKKQSCCLVGKQFFFSKTNRFLSKTKCLLNFPFSKIGVFGFVLHIGSLPVLPTR